MNNEQTESIPVENVENNETTKSSRYPNMLYRHPDHKLVGGVCGGIANFLGIDPVLVRIFWVIATLITGGGGFMVYLALLLLLPVGTAKQGQVQPAIIELNERSLGWVAFVLIGLGVLWLLSNIGILPWIWVGIWAIVGVIFWPAVLIGAGFLLLNRKSGQHWRDRLDNATSQFRTQVNNRMPNRNEMKSGIDRIRQTIPLTRSRDNRMFLGVCGGIGEKFNIDANFVRIVWGAFSIGSVGMGVFVYLVTAFFLQDTPVKETASYEKEAQDVQVVEGTINGAS